MTRDKIWKLLVRVGWWWDNLLPATLYVIIFGGGILATVTPISQWIIITFIAVYILGALIYTFNWRTIHSKEAARRDAEKENKYQEQQKMIEKMKKRAQERGSREKQTREEFFNILEAHLEFWLSDKVDHAQSATALVEGREFVAPTTRDRLHGAIFSTLVAVDEYAEELETGELHSEWARKG